MCDEGTCVVGLAGGQSSESRVWGRVVCPCGRSGTARDSWFSDGVGWGGHPDTGAGLPARGREYRFLSSPHTCWARGPGAGVQGSALQTRAPDRRQSELGDGPLAREKRKDRLSRRSLISDKNFSLCPSQGHCRSRGARSLAFLCLRRPPPDVPVPGAGVRWPG